LLDKNMSAIAPAGVEGYRRTEITPHNEVKSSRHILGGQGFLGELLPQLCLAFRPGHR
jgi:hypothetical protein